jgi:hypothetical protein
MRMPLTLLFLVCQVQLLRAANNSDSYLFN